MASDPCGSVNLYRDFDRIGWTFFRASKLNPLSPTIQIRILGITLSRHRRPDPRAAGSFADTRQNLTMMAILMLASLRRRSGNQPGTISDGDPVLPPGGVIPPRPLK